MRPADRAGNRTEDRVAPTKMTVQDFMTISIPAALSPDQLATSAEQCCAMRCRASSAQSWTPRTHQWHHYITGSVEVCPLCQDQYEATLQRLIERRRHAPVVGIGDGVAQLQGSVVGASQDHSNAMSCGSPGRTTMNAATCEAVDVKRFHDLRQGSPRNVPLDVIGTRRVVGKHVKDTLSPIIGADKFDTRLRCFCACPKFR